MFNPLRFEMLDVGYTASGPSLRKMWGGKKFEECQTMEACICR